MVTGTEATTYVYCGDRWKLYDERDYGDAVGRQAWFPMTLDAQGVPTIQAPGFPANGGDWTLDPVTGRWEPASVAALRPAARGSRAAQALAPLPFMGSPLLFPTPGGGASTGAALLRADGRWIDWLRTTPPLPPRFPER